MISTAKKFIRRFLAGYGISVGRDHISIGESAAFIQNPQDLLSLDFDFIVRDFLESLQKPENVSFIEIGALDGVSGDPLHHYISRYHWEGLLVEPQPKYFEQLKNNYDDFENLEFFEGAVGRNKGYETLYVVDSEAENTPAGLGGIASFDRDHLLSRVEEEWIRQERVQVEHPMSLIKNKNMTDCDIIQIDVEGFDAEVVRMLDFDAIHPSIIQFEHVNLTNIDHRNTVNLLISNGYKVCQSGPDTVAYRRPECRDFWNLDGRYLK